MGGDTTKQTWVENQIKRMFDSTDIMPSQKEILKRFDKEAEKIEGLSITSRQNQLHWIFNLAKAVPKDFKNMTKEDIENFLFSLELSSSSSDLCKV